MQNGVSSKRLWVILLFIVTFAILACNRVSPPLGVWYRGESLGIVAFEVQRVQEMYFQIGKDIYKIETEKPKTELVAIRLVLINSKSTSLQFDVHSGNVQIKAKGLNEWMSHPIDPFNRGQKFEKVVAEGGPGFVESLLWGSFQHTGVGVVKSLLWGSLEIEAGEELEGWIIFDVPKGTMFDELKWNAGDTVVMGK